MAKPKIADAPSEVLELHAAIARADSETNPLVDHFIAEATAVVDQAERLARAARGSNPRMRAVAPGGAAPASGDLTARFAALK